MMNVVMFQGRLTKDPELRSTSNGKEVCTFSIAVDRDWSPGGEKETDFFNCIAFGNTGTVISQNFGKGKPITVTGSIQISKWTDQNGQNKTAPQVVVQKFWFSMGETRSQQVNSHPSPLSNQDDDNEPLPF